VSVPGGGCALVGVLGVGAFCAHSPRAGGCGGLAGVAGAGGVALGE